MSEDNKLPKDAILIDKISNWDVYVCSASNSTFINATDYHPGLLKLTKNDLQDFIDAIETELDFFVLEYKEPNNLSCSIHVGSCRKWKSLWYQPKYIEWRGPYPNMDEAVAVCNALTPDYKNEECLCISQYLSVMKSQGASGDDDPQTTG